MAYLLDVGKFTTSNNVNIGSLVGNWLGAIVLAYFSNAVGMEYGSAYLLCGSVVYFICEIAIWIHVYPHLKNKAV